MFWLSSCYVNANLIWLLRNWEIEPLDSNWEICIVFVLSSVVSLDSNQTYSLFSQALHAVTQQPAKRFSFHYTTSMDMLLLSCPSSTIISIMPIKPCMAVPVTDLLLGLISVFTTTLWTTTVRTLTVDTGTPLPRDIQRIVTAPFLLVVITFPPRISKYFMKHQLRGNFSIPRLNLSSI